MNGTATTSTTGVTGGAQGWQGYVSRIAYNGGTHRLATRPAQTSTTGNNQDLVTEGSSSMSYTGAVNLASVASTFTAPAGTQLTENLRITLTAPNTCQIESKLYQGGDTLGTLLVSQTASGVTGGNFYNGFDSLAIGWRATATNYATTIDISVRHRQHADRRGRPSPESSSSNNPPTPRSARTFRPRSPSWPPMPPAPR